MSKAKPKDLVSCFLPWEVVTKANGKAETAMAGVYMRTQMEKGTKGLIITGQTVTPKIE